MENDSPYRQAPKPGYQYKIVNEDKVVNEDWQASGWKRRLEEKLNQMSLEGWRPILYSDSGGKATLFLERPNELP